MFTTVDDLLRWDRNFYDSSLGDPEFLTMRFERDASGTITGFQLDAGRVKNLRFKRLP